MQCLYPVFNQAQQLVIIAAAVQPLQASARLAQLFDAELPHVAL
jgi:hypothetical protein